MYFININETKKSNPITNISLFKALESFQFVMKERPKKALKSEEPEKAKQLEEKTQIFMNSLKKVGLQNWEKVNIGHLKYITKAFNMTDLSDTEAHPVVQKAKELLGDQNYKHASDIIVSFSLQNHFDCKELITILVSRGSID